MHINKIFKEMQNDRKKQVVFAVVAMCILVFLYVFVLNSITKNKALTNYIQFDNKVLMKIEELAVKGETLSVSGWIMHVDKEQFVPRVALRATNGEEILILDTKLIECTDVNDVKQLCAKGGMEYSLKGYSSKEVLKGIEIENCYEIVFVYASDSNVYQSISSKHFYYAGKVYDYNPLEVDVPEFHDAKLAEVVSYGNMRAYDAELGICVYQYGGQLYWMIKEKSSLFSETGRTEMPYHITTFFKEDLPESRNQYGFDNKDFFFEDKELVLAEKSEYRVAVVNIPSEYTPLHITSGVYDSVDKKWIWKTTFQAMTIYEQK